MQPVRPPGAWQQRGDPRVREVAVRRELPDLREGRGERSGRLRTLPLSQIRPSPSRRPGGRGLELHQVPGRWRRRGHCALRAGCHPERHRGRPCEPPNKTRRTHARPRWIAHSRHDPVRGGHVVHAGVGLDGRRRGQGRATGTRRPRPGRERQRGVLRGLELQQAQCCRGPRPTGRAAVAARHAAELRRLRGELRAGRDGEAPPRLRHHEGRSSRTSSTVG